MQMSVPTRSTLSTENITAASVLALEQLLHDADRDYATAYLLVPVIHRLLETLEDQGISIDPYILFHCAHAKMRATMHTWRDRGPTDYLTITDAERLYNAWADLCMVAFDMLPEDRYTPLQDFDVHIQIRRACAFAYWNESPEVFQAHVHTYIEDGADTPDRHIAKVAQDMIRAHRNQQPPPTVYNIPRLITMLGKVLEDVVQDQPPTYLEVAVQEIRQVVGDLPPQQLLHGQAHPTPRSARMASVDRARAASTGGRSRGRPSATRVVHLQQHEALPNFGNERNGDEEDDVPGRRWRGRATRGDARTDGELVETGEEEDDGGAGPGPSTVLKQKQKPARRLQEQRQALSNAVGVDPLHDLAHAAQAAQQEAHRSGRMRRVVIPNLQRDAGDGDPFADVDHQPIASLRSELSSDDDVGSHHGSRWPRQRRTRTAWSPEDTEFLRHEVTRYYLAGKGPQWADILERGLSAGRFLLPERTAVDLKDKWRVMKKHALRNNQPLYSDAEHLRPVHNTPNRRGRPPHVLEALDHVDTRAQLLHAPASHGGVNTHNTPQQQPQPQTAPQRRQQQGGGSASRQLFSIHMPNRRVLTSPRGVNNSARAAAAAGGAVALRQIVPIPLIISPRQPHVRDRRDGGAVGRGGLDDAQLDNVQDVDDVEEMEGAQDHSVPPTQVLADTYADDDDIVERVSPLPPPQPPAAASTGQRPAATQQPQPSASHQPPAPAQSAPLPRRAPQQPALVRPSSARRGVSVRDEELEAAGEHTPKRQRVLPASVRRASLQGTTGDAAGVAAAASPSRQTPRSSSGGNRHVHFDAEQEGARVGPSSAGRHAAGGVVPAAGVSPAAAARRDEVDVIESDGEGDALDQVPPPRRITPVRQRAKYKAWSEAETYQLMLLIGEFSTAWSTLVQVAQTRSIPGLQDRTWQKMHEKFKAMCRKGLWSETICREEFERHTGATPMDE